MTYTRLLKKGMAGEDVRAVKDKLVELGYLKTATHSTFGGDTKEAVKTFQRAEGLEADGVVGPLTWAALFGGKPPDTLAPAEPSDKAKRMCELAALYIGHPYVWGASGQRNPSNSYIYGRNQTKADADRSIRFRDGLTKQGVTEMRCFDCSGFISFLMREVGAWDGRRDCDGLWSYCTPIDKSELTAGDFLLRGSATDKTHIGLYIGCGWCIHAKGRDVGVVKEPIDLKAGYWKYFGRCKLLSK